MVLVAIVVIVVVVMVVSARGRVGGRGLVVIPTAGVGDDRAAVVGNGCAQPKATQHPSQHRTQHSAP